MGNEKSESVNTRYWSYKLNSVETMQSCRRGIKRWGRAPAEWLSRLECYLVHPQSGHIPRLRVWGTYRRRLIDASPSFSLPLSLLPSFLSSLPSFSLKAINISLGEDLNLKRWGRKNFNTENSVGDSWERQGWWVTCGFC